MARTYTVTLANTDFRAPMVAVLAERAAASELLARETMTGKGAMIDAAPVDAAPPVEGAEPAAPIIPVTLTLTVADESGISTSETVTADQCWQLTGLYGDTRRLVDLDDTALAEVLSVWAANVGASLDATMADESYAAEVAKVRALESRLAGGLAVRVL